MNKALQFQNWNKGGSHYVLKASSENKWVGFQETVINSLRKKFNDDFFLVIWTDKAKDDDFYKIPFKKVKHVFTDEHKTTGKYPDRWTAIIWNDQFLMHSNSQLAVDISTDYGNNHDKDESINHHVEEDLSLFEIENEYFEGTRKSRLTNFYERNPKLRVAAIKIHGFSCKVCGFNFERTYGELGIEFIEVHHLKPVSTLTESTIVSPENDMTVVCSNCHRMLHRNREKLLTPDELKVLSNINNK